MLVFSMKKYLEDIGGVFDGGLDREWDRYCCLNITHGVFKQ